MSNKSFFAIYFFSGLLCGFLLRTHLDTNTAALATKLFFAGAIICLLLFYRRIETGFHKKHLDEWEKMRRHGKWFFIVVHYVVMRGFIVLLLFVGPLYTDHGISPPLMTVLVLVAVLIGGMFSYAGHEEWKACESEHQIQIIRQAAEESRFISSIKN